MAIAVASTAAATFSVMTGWVALDLPRPAWISELRAVSDQVQDNRELLIQNSLQILQNDWWRYQTDIEDLEAKIEKKPDDRQLKSMRQRLRQEQAQIQDRIDNLKP